jgi:hypothetical protein
MGGDAGTGGGANACSILTCTGCCDGDTCVATASQSTSRCGNAGGACMACGGNEQCRTSGTNPGTCFNAGTGIGAPCTSDSDCTGVDLSNDAGGPAFCQMVQLQNLPGGLQTQGVAYPGGYCTRKCFSGAQCGANNTCAVYGGVWGDASNICVRGCQLTLECRPGYVCLPFVGGAVPGFCLPANLPDGGLAFFDAGPGPSPATLGKDCTKDSDCRGETGYGRCLSSLLVDGGQSGYGAGECIADCSMTVSDAWCNGDPIDADSDGGARCDGATLPDDSGVPFIKWLCKKGCTADADCKSGYHCRVDHTGGKVCDPSCNNPGAADTCGASCLSSWGCLSYGTCSPVTHDCG